MQETVTEGSSFNPGSRFPLASLTKTSQGTPNTPPSLIYGNLIRLQGILDDLYNRIGPIALVSAYRSQATQDALRSSGNDQAVEKSAHSLGMAADITPLSMPPQQFLKYVLEDPYFKDKIGQIAVKTNSIHFQLPNAKFPDILPFYVADDGLYYRFKDGELPLYLASGVKPEPGAIDQVVATATQEPVKFAAPWALVGIALVIFFMTKRKNPNDTF